MSPLTFLIFVAFVPLLWLERQGVRRWSLFGYVYLAMLIWNSLATWWIWNSTAPGAIGAIMANSLLMCIPWLGFSAVKKRLGDTAGYISLVVFWISFEYIHLQNWGLSWPWLTVGNVFASRPNWIQWYEYTGESGGSLWVMTANILLFRVIWKKKQHRRFDRQLALFGALTLIVPFLLSGLVLLINSSGNRSQQSSPGNIVIVQPNIDPYEKIETGSFEAQLQKLIRLSDTAIDKDTKLVVWPETALFVDNGIDEEHMKENRFLAPLWDFMRRHPNINLLTGIESYRTFKFHHSPSARLIPEANLWFESYNAAALLDSSGPVSFYHKSKLVPGVETLPPFLHILDAWFEKFGGTTAGYTGQDDRSAMISTNQSWRIAPAVCYESIYGEFISHYIDNGADIIAIITNDGWWGDTPGYKQHLSYARLRAIENRRWVIRSANTGISAVISADGHIETSQPWQKEATIKCTVSPVNRLTFYCRYGDCISKLALVITVLFLGWHSMTLIKIRTSRG